MCLVSLYYIMANLKFSFNAKSSNILTSNLINIYGGAICKTTGINNCHCYCRRSDSRYASLMRLLENLLRKNYSAARGIKQFDGAKEFHGLTSLLKGLYLSDIAIENRRLRFNKLCDSRRLHCRVLS